jgi:acyl transferase domain-containing protein/acyl carrier protein
MDKSNHHSQANMGREGAIQDWLQEHLGELLGVDPGQINIDQPFNIYGLSSVDAVNLSGELSEFVERELSPTIVYDYPTIARLAQYLAQPVVPQEAEEREVSAEPVEEAIAIIGMACRFPGDATTPEAFWELLSQGKNTTTEIPSQRWDREAYYDPSSDTPGKMYTRHGSFLTDLEGFDANFFSIPPREALRIDPQQRLLMEVAWEAVENAGFAMSALTGSQTGVFIGMMNNLEYSQLQMEQGNDSYQDDPYFGTGSSSSVASGRLAYLFDWHGPALTVDTACSSSLVSLHLACQSLRKRECTVALVGGVNTILRPETMVNACKMGMLATDGYCKTFDSTADGFVMGEGCGVVILKPLADALADGNPVLAVVRGSAVNQDGRSNGMTAPNKLAQEAAIRQALRRAGVDPRSVSYVEAHGSGTALGDPIEIAALEAVFGEGRTPQKPLLVGAVKTNVGHLLGAAGMAGLIKTVLALQHKEIPPHLNMQHINPHVSRVQKVTAIPTKIVPWHEEQPTRLAGVSSFGWSGTNAHVVLEEAPCREETSTPVSSAPTHLLVLSAHTETALDKVTDNLLVYMQEHQDIPLAWIASQLQSGRSPLQYKRMLVSRDREDALTALSARPEQRLLTGHSSTVRPVAFLFSGVGEQYVDLAQELYQLEATFRETVDTCCALLKEQSGLDPREALFSSATSGNSSSASNNATPAAQGIDLRRLLKREKRPLSAAAERLRQTAMAQPAAFVIEYALARLLEKWGIRPSAMLGYSLGEYVAACLSGVFSLEDALLLVAQRAKMIQELPGGAMVAVFLSEKDVQPYLTQTICLSAINAPATCVLAGPVADIELLESSLVSLEIAHRRLETTHAFHSTMLDPVQESLTRLVEGISLHAPSIPYISNVTGTWITAEEATDPAYWARHMCQTVRLSNGVEVLLRETNALFLEVGPGQSLSSFVRQHTFCTRERASQIFSTLPAALERQSDYASLLTALGKMWLAGANVDWSGLQGVPGGRFIPLPTYPFEHQRYWIDAVAHHRPGRSEKRSLSGKTSDVADWFYLPIWKKSRLASQTRSAGGLWLVFEDATGIGQQLAQSLEQNGSAVIRIQEGAAFSREASRLFRLRPGNAHDYIALLEALRTESLPVTNVVHCWSILQQEDLEDHSASFANSQQHGLYSLLYLARALGSQVNEVGADEINITVFSSNVQPVLGNERLSPAQATLLAACKVIPQEYPNISCRSIDLNSAETAPIANLCIELQASDEEKTIAYRNGERWVQDFKQTRLEAPETKDLPLRQGGVYLLTGGMGGLGLVLAEYLAKTVQARLVMIGRSSLPPRHEWQEWLDKHEEHESSSNKIRSIQVLEQMGAEVLYLQADVANKEQMQQAVAQAHLTFGALHGVIHAAGVFDEQAFGVVQEIDPEAVCELHFQPKVYGTLVLEQVLEDYALDFCLLFSSLVSILGGLGFVGYTAANAFMDTLAHQHNQGQPKTRWTSLGWDIWQVKEERHGVHRYGVMGSTVSLYSMTASEGIDAFTRLLANKEPTHTIVSTGDLNERIRRWLQLETLRESKSVSTLYTRPTISTPYVPVTGQYERRIAEIFREELGLEQVGLYDNFFDLGGNSLLGLQVIARLKREFHMQISAVTLFESPTVNALARYLSSAEESEERPKKDILAQRRQRTKKGQAQDGVAIIGMAGRFPGASDVEQLWQNICAGVEATTFFSNEELLAAGVDPRLIHNPDYVKARPFLKNIDLFDGSFFGYSPREVELTDPQHRLFLECAWEALEQAGYDPYRYQGLVGVFGGSSISSYMMGLATQSNVLQEVDSFQLGIGNDKDSLTTTVSYKLNLKGPSLAVQTFCSTSLVATHLACQNLLHGECDIALSGGVSLKVPAVTGYLYQEGGMESPDGHCRTFDAQAGGSNFGDGVAIVALKRLEDALEDGDTIYAVIKGSAINNDGSVKVSYSAPSVVGQAEVVVQALANAGVSAESIDYIEAHGTATKLGDPIEVASLTRAYRTQTEKERYCRIGSIKTNIGHLDRAAGVTGLIKATLSLQREQIPASLHFTKANPEIDFEHSPFFVNTSLFPWKRNGRPRRAGVNSLGMGGTNAHLILEEAPIVPASGQSRPWQVLMLSAKTETALKVMAENLCTYLQQHEEAPLADIAYTLQIGRSIFNYRRVVICRDRMEAIAALQAGQGMMAHQTERERKVSFVFSPPHQQYTDMARELYQREETFRASIDHSCLALRKLSGLDVQDVLFKQTAPEEVRVFIIANALARLLWQWGMSPQAMLGDGVGEYVVACLAGVFSFEDALTLIIQHSQPDSAESLQGQVARIALHSPRIPYISSVTGNWITAEQAIDPDYWLQLPLTGSAGFASGVEILLQETESTLLEINPGQSSITNHPSRTLQVLPAEEAEQGAQEFLLNSLGKLWLAGIDIDWEGFYTHERRRHLPLPTYPFERKSYWLKTSREQSLPGLPSSPAQPVIREKIADWFYRERWEQTPLIAASSIAPQNWLIFPDASGIGESVAERLQQQGHSVVRVYTGTSFTRLGDAEFQVRPGESDDYIQLCTALSSQNKFPDHVWHGWNISGQVEELATSAAVFRVQQEQSFYGLIFLARALSSYLFDKDLHLLVFSSHIQPVTGQEALQPEKVSLLGACKVISQEPLSIVCRSIDLDTYGAEQDTDLVEQCLAECAAQSTEQSIAYRNGQRLVQKYEAVSLAPATPEAAHLRQEGVYLITGGLGGIGLALGEYLTQNLKARLILVNRSPLPPRDTWQELLQSTGGDSRLKQKISSLLKMEKQGGVVMVCQADIADDAQIKGVVQSAIEAFGTIHGVFHAAGITDPEMFKGVEQLTREDCEVHFHPKVYGTYALQQALAGMELDFCLLFSSLSAVLGGLGFSPYAAANTFLDAIAHRYNRETRQRWLSVNWDTWLVNEGMQSTLGGTIAAFSMTPAEGIEAMLRVLASSETHLVHSTGNLNERLLQWVRLEAQKKLAQSDFEQEGSADLFVGEDYEQQITQILQQVLGIEHIGRYENFFELGGNSLIALDVIARLKKVFRRPIPAVALFEAPTVSALAEYLRPPRPEKVDENSAVLQQRRDKARLGVKQDDIAIIGMACRFPGATTVEEFWQNLCQGVESISSFSDEELLAAGVEPWLLDTPGYVKRRAVLNQVDQFDAHFFGYSAREADLTDPQHRLFLECAWEVLEQAGYDCLSYEGQVGVFGGTNISTYLLSMANNDSERLQAVDGFQIVISNDKDSLTTMTSYKLNLRGPSFAVQTFCSTSLVATHLAAQSLLRGECDMALAGGVSIRVPDRVGYMYQEGGQESPDGHCRAFDEHSQGSVFGDGVGIVVLKRFADALEDGDTIHAVIKGSAINNDGSLKVSYSAPSVVGQANVVMQALQSTALPVESIGYIETHGTGTNLGDPIEIASLTKAFRSQTDKVGFCPIGSLKTNVGHLDRAAGVAGLIKTVMTLKHGLIPPTLHFQAPNPEIDFASSPFFVNAQLRPWTRGATPRRAGVNSLGMGGTNAHVIVEEAPQAEPSSPAHPWQLLVWSAKTETALQAATRNLQTYFQEHREVNLTDVAYTLQRGRAAFAHRHILVCHEGEDAIARLGDDAGQLLTSCQERRDRKVAFLFPGVGEQTAGLTRELYETEPGFRETVDNCCALVKRLCNLDLASVLYPENTHEESVSSPGTRLLAGLGRSAVAARPVIRRVDLAQPAVFVLEYALARLFMQWGIAPQAMLGYSLGEYVAACLAGVFSLEDALMLVTRRAQLIQELPESALLVVALSEEEIQPYLSEQINLAIVNAPHTCVLGGPSEEIALLAEQLRKCAVACSFADTSHAFHTSMLHSLRERFIEILHSVSLRAPGVPYISNVSGTWITADQATDPLYWADHMCQTVRFADGVQQLLQDTDHVILEIGPGQALGSFVRQNPACKRERFSQVVATLSGNEVSSDAASVLVALGKLWLAGVTPDWPGLYKGEHRKRLPLPTYPFERHSHWIATQKNSNSRQIDTLASPETVISRLKLENLSDWFYVPGWKSASPLSTVVQKSTAEETCWLLFLDKYGFGEKIAEQLRRSGKECVLVSPGQEFARLTETHYTLNPLERSAYASLFSDLHAQNKKAWNMVHLWSLDENEQSLEEELRNGFYSVFALAQAFGEADAEQSQLFILSNHTQNVTGSEWISPARATLSGPCNILPQEYANLKCRGIDLVLPQAGAQREKALIRQVVDEITSEETETLIALRANRRWLPTFDALHRDSTEDQTFALRREGVYLITGGLGGIGLAIARFLAQQYQAKLVLLGRNGLPSREQWQAIMADEDANQQVRRRIQHIQELEALGTEVLVLQADVCNREQMRSAVGQIQERFGCLHGVLHTAGVPGVGLTQLKTTEQARDVLGPKVAGTMILEEILAETEVELLVLFSSITARMGGGPGQIDYSAANAFLGAYAQNWRGENRQVVAIDWGEWKWNAWETGLAGYDSQVQAFFKENRRKFGIAFEDGAEALIRVLATGLSNVVVSTQDFPVMVSQSKRLTAAYAAGQGRASHQNQETHPRPELVDLYMPARNESEQKIVELWEGLLGVVPVGVNDNFFELGGNSLVGIDLIARLRKMFQLETLAAHVLYEAPTISKMALYIENGASTQGVQKRLERGGKRLASQKQRIHQRGVKKAV